MPRLSRLASAFLLACALAAPAAAEPPSPAAAAAPDLPELTARIRLPGRPSSHLNLTFRPGTPDGTLTGCVSSAPGSCRKTHRLTVDAAGQRELLLRWRAATAAPQEPPAAGGLAFTVSWKEGTVQGELPPDPGAVPQAASPRARLAAWFIEAFEQGTGPRRPGP